MKKFFKFIFILLLIILLLILAVGIYGFIEYKRIVDDYPIEKKVEAIRDDPNYVTLDNVSKLYLNAVVAVEDHRFYSHGPIDFLGIARAIFQNVKQNELKEGGSTLTQQVAKNMYLMDSSYNKNFLTNVKRKSAEAFIAYELEQKYSKDEILELYINIINFGDNHYGIKEAANAYVNKEPKDLNLSESAMLAGIPNAPSVYAPTANKDLCKSRQKKVIESMVEYGYLSTDQSTSYDQTFIDNIQPVTQ